MVILLWALPASVSAQSILFVDADASPSGADGQSWSTAYPDLQTALSQATTGTEIWIAEGVYRPVTPSSSSSVTLGERRATFALKNGVALYGGFDGTEQTRSERDVSARLTVLSGDLLQNDGSNVFYSAPTRSDNSIHVVTADFTDRTAILDGVTVTGGNANRSFPEDAGGALFMKPGSPVLRNVTFADNSARTAGGALLVSPAGESFNPGTPSRPLIVDCTFTGNTVNFNNGRGGGLYLQQAASASGSGPVVLDNLAFKNNAAERGGGIRIFGNDVRITGSTFSGNQVSGEGGAIQIESGDLRVESSTFEENIAQEGGAVFYEDEATLVNSVFAGNSARFRGGAVTGEFNSSATLIGVQMSGNVAPSGGGAIAYSSGASLTLVNATVTGNDGGTEGGGIWASSSSTVVRNSIFWNNAADDGTVAVIRNDDQNTFQNVLLDGGCTSITRLTGARLVCEDVVTGDPMFAAPVDPASAPSAGGNVQLMAGSGAIDAGNNAFLDVTNDGNNDVTVDLFGNPRIQSDTSPATVDLGAFEAPGSVLPVELASFTARSSGSVITLSWSTAGETNNAGFYVEHASPAHESTSEASRTWTSAGFVKGSGTTSELRSYSYRIEDLRPGTHRVRLRQVDVDGSVAYSDVQTVSLKATDALTLRIAPNPVRSAATLTVTAARSVRAEMRLYDLLGRQVAALPLPALSASEPSRVTLDPARHGLASGTYFLRLQLEDGTAVTRQVVIVR